MKEYKDSKGNKLQIGDLVSVAGGLFFEIRGFNEIVGQTMASGDYGDFNISIIELVPDGRKEDIFVWGASDGNGESYLYNQKPEQIGNCWNGDSIWISDKKIFPQMKPQKYKLVPVKE